jgi:hypothetical protein
MARQSNSDGLPFVNSLVTFGLPLALAVASILAALFARPAVAGEVEQPTQELEALVRRADFDAAEKEAQRMLASGSLARRQVARVYLDLGIVAAAKRDSARSEIGFRKALRLDRDLRLPPWVGPSVAGAFERAKATLAGSTAVEPAIALTPVTGMGSVSVDAGAPNNDGLARRLLVQVGDVREVRDLGEAPLRFELALPASVTGCATFAASVVDEHGNELWPRLATAEVCRPSPPSSPPLAQTKIAAVPAAVFSSQNAAPRALVLSKDAEAPARPAARSVWVSGAATGAAAVGPAVLGLVALERRGEYDDSLNNASTPDEQKRLRNLASTAELRATVGTVVTALLATATVVLYIRGRF